MIRITNSNKKRFWRVLVCFALILCFLGNAIVTPVRASALAISTVAIGTLLVVGSIIMGLGILPTAGDSTFRNVTSSVVSSLNLGEVIDVFTWVASGFQRFAVPESLVQSVRGLLWSDKVVSTETVSTVKFPAGTTVTLSTGAVLTLSSPHYMYSHQYQNLSAKIVLINVSGGYPKYTTSDGSSLNIQDYMYTYCSVLTPAAGEIARLGLPNYRDGYYDYQSAYYFMQGHYQHSPKETTVVTQGVTAGHVAEQSTAIADGYSDWYSNSVSVPAEVAGAEEAVVAVPIAPGITWDETVEKTQEEVWAGSATWTDVETGTGTGTESGSIAVTIPGISTLVDFFVGTSVVESPLKAIRFGALFDLFPFNIPKGIYDTINFWNSSASPPVISIPLPNVSSGGVDIDTYELDFADIPGMNTLAALIRGGELILFAIGLLLITRKVTKW